MAKNYRATRTANRRDGNHEQIKTWAEQVGAYVIDTSRILNAFDMLIAYRGKLIAVEVKDPQQCPKYFSDLCEVGKKQFLLSDRLSEGESECRDQLHCRNVPYHIVYDQPSLLRALGHKEYKTMPNAASVK